MAVIPSLYRKLVALGVPAAVATKVATQGSQPPAIGDAVADLAGGATLPTTVTKVNELLAALREAGVIDT